MTRHRERFLVRLFFGYLTMTYLSKFKSHRMKCFNYTQHRYTTLFLVVRIFNRSLFQSSNGYLKMSGLQCSRVWKPAHLPGGGMSGDTGRPGEGSSASPRRDEEAVPRSWCQNEQQGRPQNNHTTFAPGK